MSSLSSEMSVGSDCREIICAFNSLVRANVDYGFKNFILFNQITFEFKVSVCS